MSTEEELRKELAQTRKILSDFVTKIDKAVGGEGFAAPEVVVERVAALLRLKDAYRKAKQENDDRAAEKIGETEEKLATERECRLANEKTLLEADKTIGGLKDEKEKLTKKLGDIFHLATKEFGPEDSLPQRLDEIKKLAHFADFKPNNEGDKPVAADDEGTAAAKIFLDPSRKNLIMDFGKPVVWIGFDEANLEDLIQRFKASLAEMRGH